MPTSLEHKQQMLSHPQMQQVTADVCAEMFGIVAELAVLFHESGCASKYDWAKVEVPCGLLRRARDLNHKLTKERYAS